MNDTLEKTAEAPIWERAHQTLNDMHDSLLKARDEAEHDGHLAANRVLAINEALSRISPPIPIAMPAAPTGAISGNPLKRGW